MDLVNLMYRYINKFTNVDILITELKDIDLTAYPVDEILAIKALTKEVERIKNEIPNEIDEAEKKRLAELDRLIKMFSEAKESDTTDKETKKFLEKQCQKLQEEKKITKDGGKLYAELFTLLTQNDLIGRYAKKMDAKELLDFITEYISVPLPPPLSQKEFNELVEVGIQNDERESLWRLAFNYNNKNIDFTMIEDYFLKVKDDYYLIELISAVQEDLDVYRLIEKIVATKDMKFIDKVADRAENLGLITSTRVKELKTKHHLE